MWWEKDFDYVTFEQRPSSPHYGSKPCFQVRVFLTKATKINKEMKLSLVYSRKTKRRSADCIRVSNGEQERR